MVFPRFSVVTASGENVHVGSCALRQWHCTIEPRCTLSVWTTYFFAHLDYLAGVLTFVLFSNDLDFIILWERETLIFLLWVKTHSMFFAGLEATKGLNFTLARSRMISDFLLVHFVTNHEKQSQRTIDFSRWESETQRGKYHSNLATCSAGTLSLWDD